jgi:transposase
MARVFNFSEEVLGFATKLRNDAKTIRDFRAGISVLLLADSENNFSAEKLSNILGISRQTIFDELNRVRSQSENKNYVPLQQGGRHNSYMTLDEEIEFLSTWEDKAKSGQLLTVPELHNDFNNAVGSIVPKSTIYRMLKRHNWRKTMPDTRHPKPDPELQEEFKKNSPYLWVKVV